MTPHRRAGFNPDGPPPTPRSEPPWGRRRRDRLPLLLLFVLAVVNALTGLYLVLIDPADLATSPAWAAALELMPGNSPAFAGALMLLAAVALPFSFARRIHLNVPGWFGLALGGVSWGAIGGAFGYSAFELAGLGTLNASSALGFCVLHIGVLYLERR